MNKMELMGHLVCPVLLRELRGGRTVGKSIISVPRVRDGERVGTDWVPIAVWDRQAVNAARYLHLGSLVHIRGRLHSFYELMLTDDGQRRSRLRMEVVVNRITYLGPRPPAGGEG